MKEAHRLYYLAQTRQRELRDLALDFYHESISKLEGMAKNGSFYGYIYTDEIPEAFQYQYDFEEFVVPIFEDEGFDVKYEEHPYAKWKISWERGE